MIPNNSIISESRSGSDSGSVDSDRDLRPVAQGLTAHTQLKYEVGNFLARMVVLFIFRVVLSNTKHRNAAHTAAIALAKNDSICPL
jgi:hypothetical protein